MPAAEAQKPSRLFDFLANYAAAHPKLMKRLGDRETESVEDKLESVEVREPVYVSGLARSGSTILLELLSELPGVVTHRYRDFPLLHIPVWWNRFLDRAEKSEDAPIERYHKDRILITRQSLSDADFATIQDAMPDGPTINTAFTNWAKASFTTDVLYSEAVKIMPSGSPASSITAACLLGRGRPSRPTTALPSMKVWPSGYTYQTRVSAMSWASS